MPSDTKPAETLIVGMPHHRRLRESNAVINRNTSAYKLRVAFKRAREAKDVELKNLRQDVSDLKAQVAALVAASQK